MKRVFADACYWIALLNPKDRLHEAAERVSRDLGPCRIVTSEMVLVELLNGLGRYGDDKRELGVRTVRRLDSDPNVEVVPQTSLQFRSAVERYASRLDKEWGATDCASFLLMEEKGMSEVLTADHHFKQAGFTILMETGE
ncbi:MAG: PIN domain-containing protein [bacterium]|nr:PIN domain-containing protein [bacterium]